MSGMSELSNLIMIVIFIHHQDQVLQTGDPKCGGPSMDGSRPCLDVYIKSLTLTRAIRRHASKPFKDEALLNVASAEPETADSFAVADTATTIAACTAPLLPPAPIGLTAPYPAPNGL